MLVTSQDFLSFPHCFKQFSSQGHVVKSLKAKGGTDCGYKSMHQFLTFQRPFFKHALFLCVCCSSLLKTLWKKKKLLVTSSFSFSYSVFYLFNELSAIKKNMKLSSANSVGLVESITLFVWERIKCIVPFPPTLHHFLKKCAHIE